MSELATLQQAIDELRCDVKQLLQDEAVTSAKLDVLSRQSDAQVAVLFEKRDQDAERVRKIELDYVPRQDCASRREEHNLKHNQLDQTMSLLDRRMSGVEAKIIKLSLMAGAIVAVVQAIGYAVINKVIG